MSKLSLSDFRKTAFVGAPVLKTVAFTEGGEDFEFDVYIGKMSYKSAVDDSQLSTEDRVNFVARNVSRYILNEDGTPFFKSIDEVLGVGDYADQGGLTAVMALTLHKAIDEVNSGGKSNSQTKMSSSASLSSTELADEQSKTASET